MNFIRPGTLLLARGKHVVIRIIARVESINIAFHNIVHVVALDVVYETVNISQCTHTEKCLFVSVE